MPGGVTRQYSLCCDPGDRSSYTIAVKLNEGGRGGSQWIHDNLRVGSIALVSAPRNHFELDSSASHHVFFAAGIGITPFLSMAHTLRSQEKSFDLHLRAPSKESAPLISDFLNLNYGQINGYYTNDGGGSRFDPAKTLRDAPRNSHVYCCGPSGFIQAIEQSLPVDFDIRAFHKEAFSVDATEVRPNNSFEIKLRSTGQILSVETSRSILDVLRENGISHPSSCGTGICGSCECGYLDGEVIHNETFLSPSSRRTKLLPCVSRGKSLVTLDL